MGEGYHLLCHNSGGGGARAESQHLPSALTVVSWETCGVHCSVRYPWGAVFCIALLQLELSLLTV